LVYQAYAPIVSSLANIVVLFLVLFLFFKEKENEERTRTVFGCDPVRAACLRECLLHPLNP